LKLKFYAFFKQATEGPNNTPKPAFYDVVGRYKWSAWTNLGVMSKEDAMKGYIEELKQIVETMALTQPVADFYDVLGPFYDFVFPDKSPTKTPVKNGNATFAATASAAPIEKKHLNGGLPSQVYHQDTVENESEGEEFSDTYDHISDESNAQVSHRQVSSSVTDGDEIISARGESELTPPRFGRVGHSYSQAGRSMSSGQPGSPQHGYGSAGSDYPLGSAGASGGNGGSGGRPPVSIPEVNEQIAVAILRLQHSMEQVCYRLDSIESRIERQASPVVRDNRVSSFFTKCCSHVFLTVRLFIYSRVKFPHLPRIIVGGPSIICLQRQRSFYLHGHS
jgi:acyl-CoA-binding protein